MLVKKTCSYLLSNLSSKESLEAIARKMNTNRNTLSQAFKEVKDESVFSWLKQQRMEKARVLLITSNFSIQKVCYEVGYSDPANFSTAFKATFHYSPLRYRKKMTQSKV